MQASNTHMVERFHADQGKIEQVSKWFNYGSASLVPAGLFVPAGLYSGSTLATGFGLLAIVRKVLSVVIGRIVYPITNCFISRNFQTLAKLESMGYVVRKLHLYKSGVCYDAVLIGKKETIDNGKWNIHALGNGVAMEMVYDSIPKKNAQHRSNTLLINGPSVGQSKGWPTRYQMGAGFEAGLQFLEKEQKATHIAMHGFSLGGGMMGEAVLQHDFTEGMSRGIRYMFVSDRTFNKLSDAAAMLVSRIVKPFFAFAGMELDGMAAARRLSELGIRHVIVQHASPNAALSDGIIPDAASLAHRLKEAGTEKNRVFLESVNIDHNDPLPKNIQGALNSELNQFFGNLSIFEKAQKILAG